MYGLKIYGFGKCNDNGKKVGIFVNKVCNCVFIFWNIFLLYFVIVNNIIIIIIFFVECELVYDSEFILYLFFWMVIICILGVDF